MSSPGHWIWVKHHHLCICAASLDCCLELGYVVTVREGPDFVVAIPCRAAESLSKTPEHCRQVRAVGSGYPPLPVLTPLADCDCEFIVGAKLDSDLILGGLHRAQQERVVHHRADSIVIVAVAVPGSWKSSDLRCRTWVSLDPRLFHQPFGLLGLAHAVFRGHCFLGL